MGSMKKVVAGEFFCIYIHGCLVPCLWITKLLHWRC